MLPDNYEIKVYPPRRPEGLWRVIIRGLRAGMVKQVEAKAATSAAAIVEAQALWEAEK